MITIPIREYRKLLKEELELEIARNYCLMEGGYTVDKLSILLGWKDIEDTEDAVDES